MMPVGKVVDASGGPPASAPVLAEVPPSLVVEQ